MGNVTLTEAAAAVLAFASALVLLANAAGVLVKVWKAWKAPADNQNNRLKDLEEWRRDADRKLNRDNDRLGVIDAGNRVTQRALLALLDHGIDGDNITQMQRAKEELQEHLISR
jgi:hypothetical protein